MPSPLPSTPEREAIKAKRRQYESQPHIRERRRKRADSPGAKSAAKAERRKWYVKLTKERPEANAKRKENREKYIAGQQRNIREQKRMASIKRLYGLTESAFQDMFSSQGGACAICKATDRGLVVDHDHDSKAVRALLCRLCNVGLGIFKDSQGLLLVAASYLGKHKKQRPE